MKIIDVPQGSPEWLHARIGVVTASNMERIITPGGKPCKSTTCDRYLARLATEWFLGQSLDEEASDFMERGTDMETEARRWYEFEREVAVENVGLCLRDDGRVGASPDGLVGDGGLVEFKCPSAEVHMMHVLDGEPEVYRVQCQGQLWITGRDWVDLCFFNPALPKVIVRVERDDEFIDALSKATDAFLLRLDAAKARLLPEKLVRDRAVEEAALADSHPF